MNQNGSVTNPVAPTPVAIIGMGCLFPKADGLGRYWANIRDRVDAISDVPETHWRAEDYFSPDPKSPDHTYARRGGFLSPVDFPALDFGIAPNNLEATDTTQLLGLLVARQALEDAGYGAGAGRSFDRDRVSVILGVTGTLELVIPLGARLGHPIWRRALKSAGVPDDTAETVVQRIADSYVGWQENSFPGLLGNVAAGRIANRLDLGGTNCVIDAACASSLGALNLALLELAAGRSDMVLTGGLDTFNDIFMYMCFSKTPALSPSGDARPFDGSADGTILGEGLGVVVLKRLEDARRDGDRVYAVIKSVGSSSDGKGSAVYAPQAEGQAKALRQAYALAGVTPDTIELVEAHGTGTKVGDATEVTALTEVYRAARAEGSWCTLGSVKSQIGHTKAAAGAAGLIKAALALYHKVLPPTAKIERPAEGLNPGASPFLVNSEPRPWLPSAEHPRRAAVSAFGFGGSNFHCVLEEADPSLPGVDWDGDVQIAAFSGPNREALRAALVAWETQSNWSDVCTAAALSRACFRPDEECRLLLVVDRSSDISKRLRDARDLLNGSEGKPHAATTDGTYFGQGARAGSLGVLFPGQGSQYVGMLRDLACRFPALSSVVADANAAGEWGEAVRLSDIIYPPSAYTDEDRARQEADLRATQSAQPAIGAVSLGALSVLEHFGIRPEVVAGHSFGELTALCAAGRIHSGAFHRLARLRGRAMADGNGERGAMLAVLAPIDQVEELVRSEKFDLVMANKNGPRQSVLSGPSAEIERAARLCTARGITAKVLPVSAAFHSRFVADASAQLLDGLRATDLLPARIPVFANTTAAEYPADVDEARSLFAAQLARPVEFVAEIEALYGLGVRTFLEVGPDAKLTGLVGSILEGRDHTALALDASRGRRGNVVDLARTLATLAAGGYPVTLSRWQEGVAAPGESPRAKPGFTVKVSGANIGPRPDPTSIKTSVPPRSVSATPRLDRQPASPPEGSTASRRNGKHPEPPMTYSNGEPRHAFKSNVTPAPAPPRPEPPALAPIPLGTADPTLLTQALQNVQENLLALQQISAQTAEVHRQFLEGQDRAQFGFQTLLEQQQRLTSAALGMAPPDGAQTLSALTPMPARTVVPPRQPAPSPPRSNAPPTQRQAAPEPPRTPAPAAPSPHVAAAPAGGNALPPPAFSTGQETVQRVLIEVVSEKTGYPAEMLEPAMQLDADLGIDSIKRVEILSAIQERLPDAPVIKPEHLGSLRTLGDIIDFLAQGESLSTATAASTGVGEIQTVLIEVVSEKTGYPAEMLEPAMQLDADLGIDSIKRVEILSAIQERLPDAPVIKPEHLGSLRTLGDIIDFLAQDTSPKSLSTAPTAPTSHSVANGAHAGNGVANAAQRVSATNGSDPLLRFVPRSYPLADPAQRELVALRSGAAIWVANDGTGLADALAEVLRARGFKPRVISRQEVSSAEIPSDLDGLVLLGSSGSDAAVKDSFRLLHRAGPALRRAGQKHGAVFVTVSRLDGAFGLHRLSANSDPTCGALAGLAKTAAHEWPEVRCKAVDVDPTWKATQDVAAAVAAELFARGPVEVGLSKDGPSAIELAPSILPTDQGSAVLERGNVVVISGGARGVTAEVALALAEAVQPTIVLLGRSPAPEPEPQWLAGLSAEAEIKKALASRANGHASPQLIGEQFRRVAANREIVQNLERIQRTGARVVYRSVDVRDAEAVRYCVEAIQSEFGLVRGVIHGAGVLADRRIEDQNDEQFAHVYDTKVLGLRSLLGALRDADLKVLALFSSSTARFGRTGQVAYAAANEVLNKTAQREAIARPSCRVLSINWGPWDGGMVTTALKPLFQSEGIGLIPLGAGAEYLVDELRNRAVDRPVEVVILGPGSTVEPGTKGAPQGTAAPSLAAVFEREVTVEALPILSAHVIDGRPVLPMALTLEWLAQGAAQRNPGLVFAGFSELRLLKGVVLRTAQPEVVRVLAGKAVRKGNDYAAPVELTGMFADGHEVAHARGEVLLAERYTAEQAAIELSHLPRFAPSVDDVYRGTLFHGPMLQGIDRIEVCGETGIAAFVATSPAPLEWISRPLRNSWLSDPLAIDCAFQLMIVWCAEQLGAGSLPTRFAGYRQFRKDFPAKGVRVVARVVQTSPHKAIAEIEFVDDQGVLVARIDEYECVIDASLNDAFRRNQAIPITPR